MRLGYFAPLPPSRSGVADYAAVMLTALSGCAEVLVGESGDINLYHIGNNRLHAEIYEHAIATPGVVLLHDAVLHHLLIGSLDDTRYRAEFVYNYGSWTADLARTFWMQRSRAMSDPRYFRYPMLRRLAERSLATVVHSEEARETVLAHWPDACVRVLPHMNLEPDEAAPHSAERERFRRESLGIDRHEFLLGVYGHLRETKRIATVLAALDGLRQSGVAAKLLVAGEFASVDYERTIKPRLGAHPCVILRGNTERDEFRLLLSAADVCVNLKHPGAGESSGIAIRAMSLGVPLMLSQNAVDTPPAGAFAPIPAGPSELPTLVESLRWLARDARARETMARAARNDCLTRRDPRQICLALTQWIKALRGESGPSV
ncbi:MAG: glycosyltransferase [Bryobacterales bacterium]|nr:glycosyltransferase [Bryobacterales bacterium]